MATWSKKTLTIDGARLKAQSLGTGTPIEFTVLRTSSHDYSALSMQELGELKDLEDIQQTADMTGREVIEPTEEGLLPKVKVSAIVDNESLTEGYDFYTYGLYARLQGSTSEKLFLVAVCEDPDPIPIPTETVWQATIANNIDISNTDNITILVDPEAYATKTDVEDRWRKHTVETRALLPTADGTHNSIDEVWYIDDENVRVYEKKISDTIYGWTQIPHTEEATEPIPSNAGLFYLNTTYNKWYESQIAIETLPELEHELVEDTLPPIGTYTNGTMVVLKVTETVEEEETTTYTLHRANALADTGYDDILIFEATDDIITKEKTNGWYYYDTTQSKLFRYQEYIWEEITSTGVVELPGADSSTVGQYYHTQRYYLMEEGVVKESEVWHINNEYNKATYSEGNGLAITGAYGGIQFNNIKINEMVAKGYTKVVIVGNWTGSGDWRIGLRGTTTPVNTANGSPVYEYNTKTAGTEVVYDISNWTAYDNYLLTISGVNGATITDIYFTTDNYLLYKGNVIPSNYSWVNFGEASDTVIIFDEDTQKSMGGLKGIKLSSVDKVPTTEECPPGWLYGVYE